MLKIDFRVPVLFRPDRKVVLTGLQKELQQRLSCYAPVVRTIGQRLYIFDWNIGQGGVPQGREIGLNGDSFSANGWLVDRTPTTGIFATSL